MRGQSLEEKSQDRKAPKSLSEGAHSSEVSPDMCFLWPSAFSEMGMATPGLYEAQAGLSLWQQTRCGVARGQTLTTGPGLRPHVDWGSHGCGETTSDLMRGKGWL